MLKKLFKKLDLYLLGNRPDLIFKIILDRIFFIIFYKHYYSIRFKKIGKNVRWGRDFRFKIIPNSVRISCPEKISIGDNVQIDEGVYLQCSEESEGLEIGNNSRINKDTHILSGSKIHIGEKVLIAPRVLICSNNHAVSKNEPIMDQGMKFAGEIIIKSGVWIAQGVIILGETTVESNSVVGAGKILKKINFKRI